MNASVALAKEKLDEIRAKNSRAKQKVTHTSGGKSFARVEAEMEIANGGKIGEIKKFEVTYTKKDGSYLDPVVKEILDKANAKKMEAALTPSDDVHRQEIEILTEVLGNQRYGRVSGLGWDQHLHLFLVHFHQFQDPVVHK